MIDSGTTILGLNRIERKLKDMDKDKAALIRKHISSAEGNEKAKLVAEYLLELSDHIPELVKNEMRIILEQIKEEPKSENETEGKELNIEISITTEEIKELIDPIKNKIDAIFEDDKNENQEHHATHLFIHSLLKFMICTRMIAYNMLDLGLDKAKIIDIIDGVRNDIIKYK